MMHAVKKFDPDKGFRLATCVMWWIKAQLVNTVQLVACKDWYTAS